MKIKYNILWIDDEELKDEIERIKRYLEDLEFTPEIDKRESDNTTEDFDFRKYNLILLDYQLNNSKTTDMILDKIRKKDYSSEIIFYSARQKFENNIRENLDRFEGVFWCDDRGNKLHLKTINVINLTLKKFQDLNNLRGLVMAETSDLNRIKIKIFEKALKKKLIGEKFFYENVIPIIISFHKNRIKDAHKFCDKDIQHSLKIIEKEFPKHTMEKFISEPLFTSDTKKDAIVKMIELLKIKSKYNNEEYKTEIQAKRNKLGHEKEVLKNGKIFYGVYEFNDFECKKIRRYIKKYRDILNELFDEINK